MWGSRLLYTVALAASACGFDASNLLSGGDDPDDAAPADGSPITGDPDAAPDGGPVPLDLACRQAATYTDRAGSDHRYREIAPGNYDRAIAACAGDGAHLVTIDDAAENTFVNGIAAGEFWIGYDDLTAEGTFGWITKTPEGFVGWGASDPSNTNDEDCAVLRDNGTWNDVSCELSRAAVCECDPFREPLVIPACMNNNAYAAGSDGRRRRLVTSGTTWSAARDTCSGEGAHLAVIGDDVENQVVEDLLTGGDGWFGYHARAGGVFAWVNGAPVGFENWEAGEPNAANDCGEISEVDGDWSTVDCGQNRDYVCECDPAAP